MYLRDFAQPILMYSIALSILYLHYHQARLYRQIARTLEGKTAPSAHSRKK